MMLLPLTANVAVLTAAGREPVSAEHAYHEAVRLRGLGDIAAADRHLKKALDLEPSNAVYHFELANLYALRYDNSAAIKKRNADIGMLELAARELEQALMLDPEYLPARYNLGVVYKRQSKYEQARQKFKEVLKRDPQQTGALMQIGAVYEEQGFFDEAKTAYQEAKELDFANPEIQAALEDLKLRKEEYEKNAAFNNSFDNMNQVMHGVRFSPDSLIEQRRRQGQLGAQSGGGMAQALPFLGSWLFQQFMQAREEKSSAPQ